MVTECESGDVCVRVVMGESVMDKRDSSDG